jgi:hypothetical protein
MGSEAQHFDLIGQCAPIQRLGTGIIAAKQLLVRLAQLITPPRTHKHRYCGAQAPNAELRQAAARWWALLLAAGGIAK